MSIKPSFSESVASSDRDGFKSRCLKLTLCLNTCLFTWVWALHCLPSSTNSSFTGQRERKTFGSLVSKDTYHTGGRSPQVYPSPHPSNKVGSVDRTWTKAQKNPALILFHGMHWSLASHLRLPYGAFCFNTGLLSTRICTDPDWSKEDIHRNVSFW